MAKPTKSEKLVMVGVKVRPIVRLALEQAAADSGGTISNVVRQAIMRGLNAAAPKKADA